MFTGLIEEVGSIQQIIQGQKSFQLIVNASIIKQEIKLGDSVAVNGVCLTVTEIFPNSLCFDVMPETMKVTNFSQLSINQKVNLERALSLNDRLGGHIVSGHIDGVGQIHSIQKNDNAILFQISCKEDILKYTVLRGSIAIDGISLTICGLTENSFTVSIIPHTLSHTSLSSKETGEFVNLETDIIAKYTERLLGFQNTQKKDISLEFLREHGF